MRWTAQSDQPHTGPVTPWYTNPEARSWVCDAPTSDVRAFHAALPGYQPTPLVDLPVLAAELGVGRLLVKDESARLGLPAFKILGASWACRQVVRRQPGAVLVTATDGNHGRAVARTAAQLGTTAVVFVPAILPEETLALISDEGATVHRVDGDYDAAVSTATAYAESTPGCALVQDMAWPGYEAVPGWIVAGYETLLDEVDEAVGDGPDLVVVPVGVGSLAQAVVTHYRRAGARRPRILSVEPDGAACLLASLTAGRPVTVPTGDTVMAGLNCGTVSSAAWPILAAGTDAAGSVSDDAARRASADLQAHGVASGPCGSATLAGLRSAIDWPAGRVSLGLHPEATVVLLSTEGRRGQ